jgi:hypothetical protein
MGGETPAGQATFRLRLPDRAEVKVFRDGHPIDETHTAQLDLTIAAPGAYRVEKDRRQTLAGVQPNPSSASIGSRRYG